MNNPNDDLNGIPPYVSSAPDFDLAKEVEVKPQDQADLPALERVLVVLDQREAHYRSIDSIQLGDITIENQMIINKNMRAHIQELRALINSTITSVKEKMNERQ